MVAEADQDCYHKVIYVQLCESTLFVNIDILSTISKKPRWVHFPPCLKRRSLGKRRRSLNRQHFPERQDG